MLTLDQKVDQLAYRITALESEKLRIETLTVRLDQELRNANESHGALIRDTRHAIVDQERSLTALQKFSRNESALVSILLVAVVVQCGLLGALFAGLVSRGAL